MWPSVSNATNTASKPRIRQVHYAFIRRLHGIRALTLTASVARAKHCSISSRRLLGKRRLSVACAAKRGEAPLKLSRAEGATSADAFTASVTIEASGPGGKARVKVVVRALSAEQERRLERQAMERAQREASERAAREAGERAAREAGERERTERESRERREREEREPKAAGETIKIGGDVAMVALVEKLAAAYRGAGNGANVAVTALPNGSDATAVAEGRYDIGLSARDPILGVDPPGLSFRKVALEVVCVITNDANAVANLSGSAVAGIFSGGLRNWSEVPGAAISGPVDLFDYEATAIRQEAFQRIFLGEEFSIAPFATPEPTDELEQSTVGCDKQAIGFVSVRNTAAVNAVGYQGISCTLEKARNGQYAGERNLWMVTRGPPTGQAASFMSWVEESLEARGIIESNWIAR